MEARSKTVSLTQRSRAVAVLVSPEQWNELVAEMEDLQDILAAREARQDAAPGMDLDEYALVLKPSPSGRGQGEGDSSL